MIANDDEVSGKQEQSKRFEDLAAYASVGNHLFPDQIDFKETQEAMDEFFAGVEQDEGNEIAPGMMTNDPLEQNATPEEIEHGDSTSVTRLYLDRTPED